MVRQIGALFELVAAHVADVDASVVLVFQVSDYFFGVSLLLVVSGAKVAQVFCAGSRSQLKLTDKVEENVHGFSGAFCD